MWKSWIILYVVTIIRSDDGEWREIKTPQGPVRGHKDPAGLYIFHNIPYATAPKGPLKFTAPLPAPAWYQTLKTTEKNIICPQAKSPWVVVEDNIMQEDCLIANIYVPVTDEKSLPVVVYVHGGAFELGFSKMMSPKRLVRDQNVIVVTFNYRLGVHGFLCLGTDVAPGNAGLKDQVALLQWVNKHIASYGGNPEDVTIAGYSAGSMSVDLLMLAKSARGLFNKVIQESGSSVASVTVQTYPLDDAKARARALNFANVDDVYALEEFYKNTPLDTLFGSSFFDRTNMSLPFGPCVERKSSSAFISEAPVNIIQKGDYKKVPVLVGFSNMEGLLWVLKFDQWKNKMNEKFSDYIPVDLEFKDEAEREKVTKIIKDFYFDDKPVSEATILSYVDYFSDVYFAYPTLRAVKLLGDNGHKEVYLYEYSFVEDATPVVPHTEVRGATHCAQTMAIFDEFGVVDGWKENNITKEYVKMKKAMRNLWGNFIKHGKPVPEGATFPAWPPAGVDVSPHMSLGQNIELRGRLLESRFQFWEDIYQKYFREPTAPLQPPHTEL